jgi:hypothetical protein
VLEREWVKIRLALKILHARVFWLVHTTQLLVVQSVHTTQLLVGQLALQTQLQVARRKQSVQLVTFLVGFDRLKL